MGPVNIGSDERVSIDELAALIAGIAGKEIRVRHTPGPEGVRGRNSDNRLIREQLGWAPSSRLREGLEPTYRWIEKQLHARPNAPGPRRAEVLAARS
jgi:nucleoside-diphosphate-sugar epimerase